MRCLRQWCLDPEVGEGGKEVGREVTQVKTDRDRGGREGSNEGK